MAGIVFVCQYLQIPKSAVPDPHNLELWLKVGSPNQLSCIFSLVNFNSMQAFFVIIQYISKPLYG